MEEYNWCIQNLKLAQKTPDQEEAHRIADGVLCTLLNLLGYEEVVNEWRKVDKWYA